MAPTHKESTTDSSTTKPNKTSWALGCFGFGSTRKKRLADQPANGSGGGPKRKGIRLLCRSPVQFRLMKKLWPKKKSKVVEQGYCGSTSLKVLQLSAPNDQALPVAKVLLIDQTTVLEHKSPELTKEGFGKHINLQLRAQADNFDHPAMENGVKCQKQPGFDKPNSIKNASRSEKPKQLTRENQEGKPELMPTRNLAKARNRHKFEGDAITGMSILMVVLTIMLLYGRLYAILCASIWFYCIPLLIKKTLNNNNNTINAQRNNLEFDSDAYKKRVVLQGFLERKHNIYAGIS